MSSRAVRARVAIASTAAVTAALLMPTQGGATPTANAARDTIEVSGTVVVLAGEHEDEDRYSLLLPSGRTLALADGFAAEPLSRFTGTVAVPGEGSGRTLTGSLRAGTLRRATSSATPVEVVRARVALPAPSPGPSNHTTYVAKVTNFGPIGLTDQQILAGVNASQAYWVRESSGQIPAWTTASAVVPVASGAGSAAAGCGLGSAGADFDAIADNVGAQAFPGVDFSGASPHHLVIVVPDGCDANVAGRARLGSSFASGGPVILQAEPGTGFQVVLDHEYGHNLGLQHANTSIEYGDTYEVMGAGPSNYVNPVLGTVYRWEQGVLTPGEVVDGTGGGSWTLSPRSSASGLRGVVFIDPDTGRRHFVDYRNGGGGDTGTLYTAGAPSYPPYGQLYRPGITVERENEASGAVLLPAPGNDGALQGGETWSNPSGTLKVTGNGAGVTITRAPASGSVAGGTVAMSTPAALRDVTASYAGFTPAPAGYRFQWAFNGQPLPNAEDRTFRPTLAMVGGALSVTVTAYAPGLEPRSVESARLPVTPAGWYAVGTRRAPVVEGTLRVGATLTALGLDWVNYYSERPADLTPTYRWTRNGTTIDGATASTYRLTAKDLGKTIQVTESPRAAGYDTSSTARSSSTAKVRIGRLTSPRPRIGGKAKVGKRVVARTKGWTNGTKFSYQWYVGKKAIKGATKKKLVVTRSLRGKKLVVKVIGKKKAYKKATSASRPTKVK